MKINLTLIRLAAVMVLACMLLFPGGAVASETSDRESSLE